MARQRISVEGLLALGKSALERRDYEEARAHFSRAIEADGASSDAEFYLGVIDAETGRDREALRHYLRAAELGTQSANLYNNIAVVQSRIGKLDDAERSYRQALAMQPDHPEACAGLGRYCARVVRRFFQPARRIWSLASRIGSDRVILARKKRRFHMAWRSHEEPAPWFALIHGRVFDHRYSGRGGAARVSGLRMLGPHAFGLVTVQGVAAPAHADR